MIDRKFLISLLCLAIIFNLSATGAMGGITFEGLVAHLKFDGDADDELGNVIAATFVGTPVFGAGVDGQALFLNGQTDYVDLGPEFGPAVIQPLTSFSISVWAKGNNVDSARVWPRACQFGNSDDSEYVALLPYSGGTPEEPAWGAMGGPRFELKKTGYGDGKENNLTLNAPNTAITPDEWANIVVVLDADRDYAAIYVNGELVKAGIYMGAAGLAYDTSDFTRNPSIIEKYDQNYIGNSADNSLFYGGIDDLQIYNRVLSPAEIDLIASGPPELAGKPKPRDGAIDVPQEVTLTWRPGEYVEGLSPKHRIFFSENFDDVNDGIGGIEQDAEYYPIEGSLKLDLGKTCYWRVDEANSTGGWDIGDLWRFTVIDHLAVDDFENYTDFSPNIIYEAWLDGWEVEANGSTVGYPDAPAAEQNIVHGGRQSMPFFYDNSGSANYSEAERSFSPAQDWTREDVGILSLWFKGHPPYVGGFTEGPVGIYTMTASGTDIWSGADEFHFAFKQVSGAASIIAKVESVGHTDPWAKAGVMIRDTLEADSRNVAILITPENGVRFQYRSTSGGITDRYFAEGITAPQWVKLERTEGGLVRGYYSEDGTTWTRFNLIQARMDMPIYVGLAVTSHNVDLTCEAKFSNVSFPDISVGPQWTNQDVGMLSNEAEPMYVTVGDSSGTAATVYHADPDAALINTWTEWNIPLMDLSNQSVFLTDVSELAIGFGGADNPQPGGSGLVFFDDIRLYPPTP